jgi:hypothetical protein
LGTEPPGGPSEVLFGEGIIPFIKLVLTAKETLSIYSIHLGDNVGFGYMTVLGMPSSLGTEFSEDTEEDFWHAS